MANHHFKWCEHSRSIRGKEPTKVLTPSIHVSEVTAMSHPRSRDTTGTFFERAPRILEGIDKACDATLPESQEGLCGAMKPQKLALTSSYGTN